MPPLWLVPHPLQKYLSAHHESMKLEIKSVWESPQEKRLQNDMQDAVDEGQFVWKTGERGTFDQFFKVDFFLVEVLL